MVAGRPAGVTDRLAALLSKRRLVPPAARIDRDLTLAAVRHGVAPLLYHTLAEAGLLAEVEPQAREVLARLAREAVVLEACRNRHLTMVLEELDRQGVRAIVFKGAALAYTHYPEPWTRPRGDTDVLVEQEAAPAAMAVLERVGLTRVKRPEGAAVTQQARFESDRDAVETSYDVHWRLADPHAFARVLPFDELAAGAVPFQAGPGLAPDAARALVIACVHRAAHHHDLESLIVYWDIDLLCRSLQQTDWRLFVDLATRYQVAAVCLRGLENARTRLSTPAPAMVVERLRASAERGEPTAVYAKRGELRKIEELYSDWRALSDWKSRGRLLRQHLFPSADYMRSVYGDQPAAMLALLYARRAVGGAIRWCRVSSSAAR